MDLKFILNYYYFWVSGKKKNSKEKSLSVLVSSSTYRSFPHLNVSVVFIPILSLKLFLDFHRFQPQNFFAHGLRHMLRAICGCDTSSMVFL